MSYFLHEEQDLGCEIGIAPTHRDNHYRSIIPIAVELNLSLPLQKEQVSSSIYGLYLRLM